MVLYLIYLLEDLQERTRIANRGEIVADILVGRISHGHPSTVVDCLHWDAIRIHEGAASTSIVIRIVHTVDADVSAPLPLKARLYRNVLALHSLVDTGKIFIWFSIVILVNVSKGISFQERQGLAYNMIHNLDQICQI